MPQNVFDYQFRLLEKELDLIGSTIRQIDEITKSIKNWTIVTWTASVGLAIPKYNLRLLQKPHPFEIKICYN